MLRVGSFFAWIDRQDVRTTPAAGTHLVPRLSEFAQNQTDMAVAAAGAGERPYLQRCRPELGAKNAGSRWRQKEL